jgi:hypothetical protein
VDLRHGPTLNGIVSEIRDMDFVLLDKDTAAARPIAYNLVDNIKGGYETSAAHKIGKVGMWVAIGVVGSVVVVAIACRPRCGG